TEPASVKKDFVAEKPPADTASKKPEPLPASSDRKAAEKPDEKNVQATAFAPGEATARTPQKLRIPTLRNASAGHDFSMPMDVLSGQKADEVEEARQRAEDAKAQKTLLIAAFAGFLAVSAGAFYFFVKDQFISPSKDNKISSETAKPSAADKEKPLPQKDQPPEPKPYEGAAQQNADKSIEIAKNFDLGGGRGTVLQWFRNSFIAAAGSASQEEWKSTFLSGDLYIVQYKLLRPRAQPIIYQFEVNVAEGKTTRGINNPAIELLGGTPVVAQEVSAPKPKKKRRQLPLPVAPKNSGKKGLTGEDFSNIENLVGTSGD
ncbi:MAG: hypothetical protein NTW04_05485, partial [Elusimicrobia bacterium]|nr:hypothetical protein [Elusimicrobiota bacterium]